MFRFRGSWRSLAICERIVSTLHFPSSSTEIVILEHFLRHLSHPLSPDGSEIVSSGNVLSSLLISPWLCRSRTPPRISLFESFQLCRCLWNLVRILLQVLLTHAHLLSRMSGSFYSLCHGSLPGLTNCSPPPVPGQVYREESRRKWFVLQYYFWVMKDADGMGNLASKMIFQQPLFAVSLLN